MSFVLAEQRGVELGNLPLWPSGMIISSFTLHSQRFVSPLRERFHGLVAMVE